MRHLTSSALIAMMLVFLPALGWSQGTSHLWVEKPHSKTTSAISVSTFSGLAEKISPAVVSVMVTYKRSGGLSAFLEGDEYSDGGIGQGSGFIIHPSGLFLTNNHVVDGADSVTVRLLDNQEFVAEILGADPDTDVALMRILSPNGKPLPYVHLGNSDNVHVGEHVLAIGNPLGLSHSVTAGIVSALGRKNLSPSGQSVSTDFIQTDASINPGNSGGPLISLHGEVIGINTAINRQGQGIGFAIPINIIKALVPQLHTNGYIVRTWLGVRVQEVTPPLAKSFGLKKPSGALVTEVIPGSPGEKIGLRSGDVITQFNNTNIRDSAQLPWLVSTAGVGTKATLTFVRDKKIESALVTMDAQPNQKPRPAIGKSKAPPIKKQKKLGIKIRDMGSMFARQLGSPNNKGVVVTEISPESPARHSGLRQRDIITVINDSEVGSLKEFTAVMDTIAAGKIVRFKVLRSGRTIFVAFER